MKRKMLSLLLAMVMVMGALPAMTAAAEEEKDLFFSGNSPAEEKTEGEKSPLEELEDAAAAIMGSLGKKDWEGLAADVKLSGDWRNDLLAMVKSQVGYQEEKDGMTLYTRYAGYSEARGWTALFVNWAAEQIGLSSSEFPQGDSYKALRSGMNKVGAVKKISRANYPVKGDLALIERKNEQLVGVIVYVSDGYASMIVGDLNGRVAKETIRIGTEEFKQYVDLNVLMERAGIEVGKGGEVPAIPEGGMAAWTNTNAVYMRSEPTTASERVTTLRKAGTAVLVLNGALEADGYIWYEVKVGKHEGYIRGDLLNLDAGTEPTEKPEAAKPPVATEIPGCAICRKAAAGVALPEECCYAHLVSMGTEKAASFLKELLNDDPSSFVVYVSCALAHGEQGGENILCLGKECGASAWAIPGPGHKENCPWHKDGLAAQERVVNIEVIEATDGQKTMILFDIYGAIAYQWYEVKTVTVDGETTTTETAIEGGASASLTVTAKGDANTTYGYYCVATIVANGTTIEIASKTTALSVSAAPIVAEAILGEEVNFTYTVDGAAAYQWYGPVLVDGAYVMSAIEGATAPKFTTYADAGVYKSGMSYYCVATLEDDTATSCNYSYTILSGYANVRLYIDELINMTRAERYEAINNTWYVNESEVFGVAADVDCIAEAVMLHWYAANYDMSGAVLETAEYPNMLCTCMADENITLTGNFLNSPDAAHSAACPWANHADTGDAELDEEYDKWSALATSKQVEAALASLYLVDGNLVDANGTIIARWDSATGAVTDASMGLVIAYINAEETGKYVVKTPAEYTE